MTPKVFVRPLLAVVATLAVVEQVVVEQAAAQYYYAPGRDYYRNDQAEGTVVGGGLGAITGALIGGSEGKSPEGALIGGAVGAIAGNLFGRSKDVADQRQAAAGYAATSQANARAAQLAVTNYDLIEMTRAGLNDSVIIGAIQTRGGRFDLSPAGLIQLKQSGVSDTLIMAAQQAVPPQTGYLAPRPVVVERPVYVSPRPSVYLHYGARRGFGPRCW